ncbi:DNA methyltransferase, partial [bacterium]|nr:DNA methyltransferase [bacterium]
NPPYSGESANKGDWIMNLMQDYKKEPGGEEKLKERNPKWINDDYVKFLRYGQYYIEKNGEGVLAFINPHGFLDNPTFRGMRWNLLKTYDKIYTIDLHGNSKKKEVCPDGSPDINVFDIQQGVSINLFVKTGQKKTNELGKVFHYDLYGKREEKYNFLWENNIKSVPYVELPNVKPHYFFVQKDFEAEKTYNMGFALNEILQICLLGPNSHRDHFAISFSKEDAGNKLHEFANLEITDSDIGHKYNLKDNRDWKLSSARKNTPKNADPILCLYRPFDYRYMLYGSYVFDYHRPQLNDNLIWPNLGIVYTRQTKENFSIFITSKPLGQHKIVTPYDGSYSSPLYLYPDIKTDDIFTKQSRTPNLNAEIVMQIAEKLSLIFTPEKEETENTFAPIDILDYIYAVLHSPTYREKYKEFLKIDFPRVPYPKDTDTFWQLVKFGGEIRQIHLLESPKVEQYITTYPQDGDNVITRKLNKNDWEITDQENQTGRIWINDQQYFDNIPLVAWEFYIGGYQPAQKWLKDRHGRELSYDDIQHYQKIIIALTETDRIMREIDKIGIE